MINGVFANHRVRVLLKPGNKCFRLRRDGERKRKSVWGCVCGPDLVVISLTIVKKGDKELVGITDEEKPKRRGPKIAGNIRKVFGLHRDDDVRKYVVKRVVVKRDKTYIKRPKIQRLITDIRLRRKRLSRSTRKTDMKLQKQQELFTRSFCKLILKSKKQRELEKGKG